MPVSGSRDSGGFFAHLTDVVKEGLERYFTGRSELKIIAEPGEKEGGRVREGGRE